MDIPVAVAQMAKRNGSCNGSFRQEKSGAQKATQSKRTSMERDCKEDSGPPANARTLQKLIKEKHHHNSGDFSIHFSRAISLESDLVLRDRASG